MVGPTAKRDFAMIYTEKKIFELPRLGFLQVQHGFRSFSDKKGILLGGGGGGGGGPSVRGLT